MIEQLWREHSAVPFPKASRCREVSGNDLIALDYTTAGCISTYLSRGSLDAWRLSVLGMCYHGLGVVARELDGEEREYFRRLEIMARQVLESVRENTKPA